MNFRHHNRDSILGRLHRARKAKLDAPPESRIEYAAIIDALLDDLWGVTPQPERDAITARVLAEPARGTSWPAL